MKVEARSESPQALVDRIERLVRLRTNGLVQGLHVEVINNLAVLTGRTNTYYAKQLATHAALEAAPDCNVSNDIEVLFRRPRAAR